MEILISFNNTYQSPGYPVMGVMNTSTFELRFVDLAKDIPETGVLGLARSSRYLFVGIQYAFDASKSYRIPPEVGLQYSEDGILASQHACSLLVLDRQSLAVVHHHLFDLVQDVHSFLLTEDEKTLFVVSTGTDEVISLELDGAKVKNEKIFWRPDSATGREDNHHVNSIVQWKGDILVSGFGKKEVEDDWNTARNGFIYNISRGLLVMEGLQQPHSLAILHGKLAFCESKLKCVRFVNETGSSSGLEPILHVGGYARGLCEIDGNIFVGTSARRNKSKSTGKRIKNVEDDDAGCTITKISADHSTFVFNLASVANEIYEMIPVNNTRAWPFKPEANFKDNFQKSWQNQTALATQEIASYINAKTPLVLVDEMFLGIDGDHFPGTKLYGFIEKDGVYWGPPENDDAAIEALQELEKAHGKFVIVFAWPAFWWLDKFEKLNQRLQAAYTTLFKNDRVKIFSKN